MCGSDWETINRNSVCCGTWISFKVTIASWIDFIFYLLYFLGLPFILLAYDKRRKNKKG